MVWPFGGVCVFFWGFFVGLGFVVCVLIVWGFLVFCLIVAFFNQSVNKAVDERSECFPGEKMILKAGR